MPEFFNKVDRIKPVYDVSYSVVLFICKAFLIGDVLITTMAVLGRFVSFIPDPAWTEEIVLTFMSYMAVLSAALAIRKGSHIRMTAFDVYLPKKVIKVSNVIADAAVLSFGVVMLVAGLKYALAIGSKGTYISLPSLSKFWMYFPIPLAGFAMIIFELEAIYNDIKAFYVKEEK